MLVRDAAKLNAAVASVATGGIVISTVAPERAPEGLCILCPADATEAVKLASLAGKARRACLIAVSDADIAPSTAESDVVEIGLPNVYDAEAPSAGVVVLSCGPVLSVTRNAVRTLRSQGMAAHVVNVHTVTPSRGDEILPLLRSASIVIIAEGHPVAALLESPVKAMAPGARVVRVADPTEGDILAAARGEAPVKASPAAGKEIDSMGNRLAERLGRLGTENAFEVLAVVNRLKAEGRDIVSFAIGEPDFPTPSNVSMAGIRAISEEKTHYGLSQGVTELRQAICAYIRRTRGLEVTPDMVVVTPGAKPILFNTIMSVVDRGDEVIYPNPGFPIYESLIDFVGAKGVPMPLWESLDFNFDPDEFRALVTDRTKLIILNSPHNPTGSVLTAEALQVVADVARERDIWVLSDEVYSQMVYDGEFKSIATYPGMMDRTIILDGFSKTYSMTGWRLGFGVMPADLATWQARIETNLNSCTATFTQWAGVEALNGNQAESLAMIAEFGRRRKAIVDGLNSIPGFSCLLPGGAFYAFPNVTEACRMLGKQNAKALQEHILFEGNVAVLPRTSFGRANKGESEQYLRFSYASSMEMIEEGLARLRKLMG